MKESLTSSCSNVVYSIWLFTFSDMKTILLPTSAFGFLYSYYEPFFNSPTQSTSPSTIQRAITSLFWVWINLLPFNISNQIQPLAVEEDKINKPWRPMPSRRLTCQEAKTLMLSFYSIAAASSILLGGVRQCALLMFLGYWYNNLQGAGGLISRNFINACGFLSFTTGATEVARGAFLQPNRSSLLWISVVAAVVSTTVQTQDMPDQAGDAIHGRRTLPLVAGDGNARWITAIFMLAWSVYCPWFWNSTVLIRVIFLLHGASIAIRLLTKRNVSDDKRTFRIWNLWMLFLYGIPYLICKLCYDAVIHLSLVDNPACLQKKNDVLTCLCN